LGSLRVGQAPRLFEAPFVEAWTYATELATRQAPANMVALNDEGSVVAKAIILEDVDPQIAPHL
jgi:hypothetical protein